MHLQAPVCQQRPGGASAWPPCHAAHPQHRWRHVCAHKDDLSLAPVQQHVPAVLGLQKRSLSVHVQAVAAVAQNPESPAKALPVGSVVHGVVHALPKKGEADVLLAPGLVGRLTSLTKLGKRAKGDGLTIGEEVAAVVEQSSPLQLSMGRLETFPGEALTDRAAVVSRAAAFLQWSAQAPGRELQYSSWLGAHLLQRFTQGHVNRPTTAHAHARPLRYPLWSEVRRNMLLRGVVTGVVRDVAYMSVPKHSINSGALLHITQFSNLVTTNEEFAALLPVGTQVAVVVQKVEANAISGTPPRIYFSCKQLEAEPGQIKKDLAAFNSGAAAVHAAQRKKIIQKQLAWLATQLKQHEQASSSRPVTSIDVGAIFLCKVLALKPFGVVVLLEDGTTQLLHITRVSRARLDAEKLHAMLPVDTELAVRVEVQQTKSGNRLAVSTICFERSSGEWLRNPSAVAAHSRDEWRRQKDRQKDTAEAGAGAQAVSAQGGEAAVGKGEGATGAAEASAAAGLDGADVGAAGDRAARGAGQVELAGGPARVDLLRSALLAADSVHLPALLATSQEPATNELLAEYLKAVEGLEARLQAVMDDCPFPWEAGALFSEANTAGSAFNSNKSSLSSEERRSAANQASRIWSRCARAHRPLVALQLSLRFKAHALRAVQSSRAAGSALLADHKSAAVCDGLALAALTLGALSARDLPALLATTLEGLADAATQLERSDADHAGKDEHNWHQTVVQEQWLRTAGPAISAWAADGPEVTAKQSLASHVFPVLQQTGWFERLRAQQPEAWRQLMDRWFGRLRRRLLTSRGVEDVETASPGGADAELPALQQALTNALGLLRLARIMGYTPRGEWWAAALCQLKEEAPQIWQPEADLSKAELGLLKRLKGTAKGLGVEGVALEDNETVVA